ncbi:MAG: PD40 domain-containing protein [Bacteroidetes bacterium]|nr:PD40 domain-containing protein [Bacteroidota bacterium]
MLIRTLLTLAACACMIAYLTAQQPAANLKARRLDSAINSLTADFAPVRYGDRVYFSSLRQEVPETTPVSRIFSFKPGEKAVLETELNPKSSSRHAAHVALMPDASRMYFTLCKDETPADCEIWYREREYEGTWGPPVRMPETINVAGFTATQPAIGWDVTVKKFVLYFVSDRPGGPGKLDIWCSPINWSGRFETPFPLPVNTAEDDVTPFFNQYSQVLFFSSNGRKGFGRFDVFSAEKTSPTDWSKPKNLGRPFNSAYDDLYFSEHSASNISYLASDRPGSQCSGNIEGPQCFDLYEISEATPQPPSLNTATVSRQ